MLTDIPDRWTVDPWFKVVGMLQQNWAVVVPGDPVPSSDSEVLIVFFDDGKGVFDEIRYPSTRDAITALYHNGFRLYSRDKRAQGIIRIPEGDFHEIEHPNGRIYSNGQYWK